MDRYLKGYQALEQIVQGRDIPGGFKICVGVSLRVALVVHLAV